MKPADYLDACHFGDVRAVMRQMIADGVKVNTIITSPPYWGLRSYLPADHPDKPFELGSEPTFALFLEHMVEVFDLCHQLLRADGTLWLNMGDSYAGSRSGPDTGSTLQGSRHNQNEAKKAKQDMTASRRRDNAPIPRSDVRVAGFKPKDMIGQPHRLAFALQDAGWWLRQDIVWNKPNPMPESTRDRCTKAHEYMFLLSKRKRYYYDWQAIREPASPNTHARLAQNLELQVGSHRANGGARADRPMKALIPSGWATNVTGRAHNETVGRYSEGRTNGVGFGYADAKPKARTTAPLIEGAYGDGKSERLGRGPGWRKLATREEGGKSNPSFDEAMALRFDDRNKRSVWTIPTESYKGAHFATFPRKLVEPCVLAGCPVGGIVFDPFFGSGTTGQVAQALGRHFIGIDLNRSNQPLQAERLRQRSFFLEAM